MRQSAYRGVLSSDNSSICELLERRLRGSSRSSVLRDSHAGERLAHGREDRHSRRPEKLVPKRRLLHLQAHGREGGHAIRPGAAVQPAHEAGRHRANTATQGRKLGSCLSSLSSSSLLYPENPSHAGARFRAAVPSERCAESSGGCAAPHAASCVHLVFLNERKQANTRIVCHRRYTHASYDAHKMFVGAPLSLWTEKLLRNKHSRRVLRPPLLLLWLRRSLRLQKRNKSKFA